MKYRVLIVEDDPMARQLFELFVEQSEQYEVVESIENADMADMEDDLALKLRAIRVNKPSFCHHHHS